LQHIIHYCNIHQKKKKNLANLEIGEVYLVLFEIRNLYPGIKPVGSLWWLTPVIPTTLEAENGRVVVQDPLSTKQARCGISARLSLKPNRRHR
jgi:hypothetical protein